MNREGDKPTNESVWAIPEMPASEESRSADEATEPPAQAEEELAPPFGYGREFVRSIDPHTIGRLVEHEVARMLDLAEQSAYWVRARAIDAIKEAETRVNEVQQDFAGLAQELHDIVESVSRAVPASLAKVEAPASRPDVVEVPPSDDVSESQPGRPQ